MARNIAAEIFDPATIARIHDEVAAEEEFLQSLVEDRPTEEMTAWEIEQEMRRDFLTLAQTEEWKHNSEGLGFDYTEQWFVGVKKGVGPSVRELTDAWGRAEEWAEKAVRTDMWLANCDLGKRRRFVTERASGLEAALTQLGLRLRYNLRSAEPQMRTLAGDWIPVDDRTEAAVRDTVASLFSFMRRSAGDEAPKAVPAAWSNANWRLVMDAILGGRMVDAFAEWLEALPEWDGTERLDGWLRASGFDFHPDVPDALVAWASMSIPLVAAARTLSPGVKHDTIPVLIGPQGCGKSTALAWLMPPEHRDEWFADGLRLGDATKDRVEALLGAVVVEVAEMSGVTTAEIEYLKAFLSRTNDKVRLAWRRNPESLPRMCSLVGTANGSTILPNDPSGNRRFLALPIERGDPAAIRAYLDRNRTQLWAEALKDARAGRHAWFPDELAEAQYAINDVHRSSDIIIEDEIRAYIEKLRAKSINWFKTSELVEDIGLLKRGETNASIPPQTHRRIGRTLEMFGCQKSRQRVPGEGDHRITIWLIPDRIRDF